MATKDKLVTAEGVKAVYEDLNGRKAELTKLFTDGDAIFRDEAHWEEYIPMTFDEIWELCHDERNFVYIGDGQMKYYPQLDLNVSSKPESITFISTAQLDGKNNHTRIIINENNEVKRDQIIDTPWFDFVAEQKKVTKLEKDLSVAQKEIENLEMASKGVLYNEETDGDALQTKAVPAKALPNASFDVIGGKSVVVNQLHYGLQQSTARYGITITALEDGNYMADGTATQQMVLNLSEPSLVNGHAYYLRGCPSNGGFETYDLRINGFNQGSALLEFGNGVIKTTDVSGDSYITMIIRGNVTVSNAVFKPRLVDLTLMFGSGNEPTSVDDPRIARLDEYLEKHPEYNVGSISSAPVDSVVSVGTNLIDQSENLLTSIVFEGATRRGFSLRLPAGTYTFNAFDAGSYHWYYIIDNTNIYIGTHTVARFETDVEVFITTLSTSVINNVKENLKTTKLMCVRGDVNYDFIPYTTTTTPIPSAILALPDYGIGVNDSVYNWVDYKEKKYHHRVKSIDVMESALSILRTDDGKTLFVVTKQLTEYGAVAYDDYSSKYQCNIGVNNARTNTSVVGTYIFSGTLRARLPESAGNTAQSARAYLAEHPLEVYVEMPEEIIDLSSILSDGDNIIKVEGGGTVTMHLPDENYAVDMPNTITYDVKVGA